MYSASRKLAALFLCLTALAGNAPFAAAQTPAPAEQRRADEATNTNPRPRKATRRTASAHRPAGPIALVNGPSVPDFLIGQAEVVVKGNQDPIIRLGLARHGPTVVEFPASDNFFAVHPGGSNVVAVDESPTLATDRGFIY